MHSQRNSRTNNEPRSRPRSRRKSGNRRDKRSRSDSRPDRALHRGLVSGCRLRQNSRFQSRTRSVRSLRRERVEMCTGKTKYPFFLWTLSFTLSKVMKLYFFKPINLEVHSSISLIPLYYSSCTNEGRLKIEMFIIHFVPCFELNE